MPVRCPTCGNDLERPGDFCLRCRSGAVDAVVAVIESDRTTLTMFDGETDRGTTTITTTPETDGRARERQVRNYVERIGEEIRRKRPEGVYVSGERWLIRRVRRHLEIPLYRLDAPNPVAAYRERQGEPPVPVVDRPPREKLGGRHTSLIGDRHGERVVAILADNPHVKKIVPGPIEAGGQGSRTGVQASVTRATPDGNLRVLLRDGGSVQTIRVVTTAADMTTGERIAAQLNEGLVDEGFGR